MKNIKKEVINFPVFIIYRVSMELQDPEQLLQTAIDVIKYASLGISPDRLMVSPELWEWIKTEIDKYNEHEKEIKQCAENSAYPTKLTMSSVEIAEMTGKPHKDVLKAIRSMDPAWEKVNGGKFSTLFYAH